MADKHDERRSSYLLIGGAGATGSALARLLTGCGHQVCLAGRESEHLSQLAGKLDVPTAICDATHSDEVAAAFETATERLGELTGVVNLAGSVLLKPAHLTSDEEWDDTVAVNLSSSFYVVRSAAKTMRKSGGSIVLMSSAAAQIGLANHEAIAAAKAGIMGLVRSAATTYAGSGLRFNAVAPGLVKSNMTRRIWENEKAAAASLAFHPLGRLGEPEDVAAMIGWLLDPASSWVSGQTFTVDGGLSSLKSAPKR